MSDTRSSATQGAEKPKTPKQGGLLGKLLDRFDISSDFGENRG